MVATLCYAIDIIDDADIGTNARIAVTLPFRRQP